MKLSPIEKYQRKHKVASNYEGIYFSLWRTKQQTDIYLNYSQNIPNDSERAFRCFPLIHRAKQIPPDVKTQINLLDNRNAIHIKSTAVKTRISGRSIGAICPNRKIKIIPSTICIIYSALRKLTPLCKLISL